MSEEEACEAVSESEVLVVWRRADERCGTLFAARSRRGEGGSESEDMFVENVGAVGGGCWGEVPAAEAFFVRKPVAKRPDPDFRSSELGTGAEGRGLEDSKSSGKEGAADSEVS